MVWILLWSNQLILKEISPDNSLEGLMLKLKLQYFGHLTRRTDRLEKTLMLVKTEGRRRRGWQRMRWLEGITNSMDVSLSKLQKMVEGQGSLACYSPWGHKESDTTEQLNFMTIFKREREKTEVWVVSGKGGGGGGWEEARGLARGPGWRAEPCNNQGTQEQTQGWG